MSNRPDILRKVEKCILNFVFIALKVDNFIPSVLKLLFFTKTFWGIFIEVHNNAFQKYTGT